ncbi:MAG: hypothetical protein M3Y24_01870, partial [Acidobacteriota bacterium]|nr:hypothetical protein [Acidobacteriota bacterium]
GWTPDGKRILFNSRRNSFADSGQLYTIAADPAASGGALPEPLPLPHGRRWLLFSRRCPHRL